MPGQPWHAGWATSESGGEGERCWRCNAEPVGRHSSVLAPCRRSSSSSSVSACSSSSVGRLDGWHDRPAGNACRRNIMIRAQLEYVLRREDASVQHQPCRGGHGRRSRRGTGSDRRRCRGGMTAIASACAHALPSRRHGNSIGYASRRL